MHYMENPNQNKASFGWDKESTIMIPKKNLGFPFISRY